MSLKVKSIIIYPIKGMQGCNVNTAKLYERGFENDRRYILIDQSNKFVSQRNHTILTQVFPTINEDEIIVKYKESSFSFPLSLNSTQVVEFKLFDDQVSGTLVSAEVDSQFSRILGESVRLVKMMDTDLRHKILIKGPASTEVSFADGYPYLVAGTASLSFLNEKLIESVAMDRFRPNIVVETAVPHEEDNWEQIKIGNAEMMIINPCSRCKVVTIDQGSGERSSEPLKTLATYRKVGNKVNFGANAIRLSEGSICIGDVILPL